MGNKKNQIAHLSWAQHKEAASAVQWTEETEGLKTRLSRPVQLKQVADGELMTKMNEQSQPKPQPLTRCSKVKEMVVDMAGLPVGETGDDPCMLAQLTQSTNVDICATTNAVTAQSYTLPSDLVTPGWNNSTTWSKVASSTPITNTTNQPVDFNNTSLILLSGVDNLQALIKDLHKQGVVTCDQVENSITSEPTSLVLATDPLPEKYHTLKQKARQSESSKSSHDDLTQEMFNETRDSAYLEGIENEAEEEEEEEEEEDKSGKSALGSAAQIFQLPADKGFKALQNAVGKLLDLFPNMLSLAYILSTSHVKEIPVLLESASTFIKMVQQWWCSTHKEETKAEQTYTCLEGTWKKQCHRAAELGAKAPNKPKRPAPITVYIILSNTSSIAQDDKSKDKVKGKGKGKVLLLAFHTYLPLTASLWNQKKSNSPCASLEEQGKGLSRKVPNVTEIEPPGNIMDKWITMSGSCQSEGPLCQATCPSKCQAVEQAVASPGSQQFYSHIPMQPLSPPWAGPMWAPPSGFQPFAFPMEPTGIEDGIDILIPSPLLRQWLEKSMDGNPQQNSDQHNFSQYLDAFIKAGLYCLGELVAVGSVDKLLDTYHSSEPKERMLHGTAVVLLNYARVDFKQLHHQAR
ncbi:hypothetical protein DACRYDRAFT_16261 [Dacryopinax primogenitus]|uniref:Uncharacterized protein n=1 Tax=Dacryopinax primogenitus (strain DJM 731) TaxID=1858805 RepID=M5FYP7_DACPD|nr:uncharacterized protein DACRYDRAFT_16261 [Dacryopinax primogenitus]EJU01639.1 hypothetical protein DACRYDRAFT_16261 [Dacryopinax primogenitus]